MVVPVKVPAGAMVAVIAPDPVGPRDAPVPTSIAAAILVPEVNAVKETDAPPEASKLIELPDGVMVIVLPAPDVAIPCVPPPGVTTFSTPAAGTAIPESVWKLVGTVGGRTPAVTP